MLQPPPRPPQVAVSPRQTRPSTLAARRSKQLSAASESMPHRSLVLPAFLELSKQSRSLSREERERFSVRTRELVQTDEPPRSIDESCIGETSRSIEDCPLLT